MKRLLSISVFIVLLGPVAGYSQFNYSGYPGYGWHDAYSGYGYGWYPGIYDDDWDNWYGASTVEEGYARGLADVIQSQALYEQLTSEALINQEAARAKQIENDKAAVEAYFATREMNRANRLARYARLRERSRELSRYRPPDQSAQLSDSELDPITGQINWPLALNDDLYSAHRATLDDLFARRARDGGLVRAEDYASITETTSAMLEELQDHIREVPTQDYILAKRFLHALAAEIQYPSPL